MEENKVEEPHAQITVHTSEKEGDLNVIIIAGEIGPFDGAAFVMKISSCFDQKPDHSTCPDRGGTTISR
jgi:hypothetical protein